MTLQCIKIAQAAVLLGGKRSGREMLFQCPCHDDQHPSLSINPKKNCWLCGPCGKSGNAWDLAAFISGNDPDNRKAIFTWLRDKRDKALFSLIPLFSQAGELINELS